ncbi:MAG: putative Ig domain-containing protein, partial [Verrucomicrobia bacterium]|nr:putative Ig domain-containing protein [Verrucomicrobiota bacterium]
MPPQQLTFTLAAGVPAGAGIDPATGVFTWTPAEARGPGVYAIGVVVSDDGVPVLSATNVFNVTVNEVNSAPVLAAIGGQSV